MSPSGEGTGAAHRVAVAVVNNDVPTDPARLRATQIEHADAAVASATTKVAKQEAFVASFTGDKKKRQQEHLKAAKEALAQAIATRKDLE